MVLRLRIGGFPGTGRLRALESVNPDDPIVPPRRGDADHKAGATARPAAEAVASGPAACHRSDHGQGPELPALSAPGHGSQRESLAPFSSSLSRLDARRSGWSVSCGILLSGRDEPGNRDPSISSAETSEIFLSPQISARTHSPIPSGKTNTKGIMMAHKPYWIGLTQNISVLAY